MSRRAGLCLLLLLCAGGVFAQPPEPTTERLSLDDAFARVAQDHPELRLFGSRKDALTAELDRAALRPALIAGASVENALGTGAARGFDQAELTLTLACLLYTSRCV